MVGIHAFPKTPFSGVTEDDLHNARQRCEKLLFKCCWSHLVFNNLLDDADPQRVGKLAGGLDTVAARWVETIDEIHKFWPPFRRNNVGLVIERANVNQDTRVTVIMGSRPLTFPTAHEAVERTGQCVLSTMNRTDLPTTRECLALPEGREHLREALAGYPQFDNELFESFKSALSMEWRNAIAWLSKQQPVCEYDPVNPEQAAPQFVPNVFQRSILDSLEGRALKVDALAGEVCGSDRSRLYKAGGIKELKAADKVRHKHRLGYYRPDAPPMST